MELSEIVKILISLAIGVVIGLERENRGDRLVDATKDEYAPLGVRTFSLVAILGCLSGLIISPYLLIAIFISAFFGILLLIYYAYSSWITRDIGITTEIALLFSFVLGMLIGTQALPIQLIIAVAVILLLFLSKKDQIKEFVRGVNRNEINAFASYSIIALLILPYLPNISIRFSDIPLLPSIISGFGWDLQRISTTEIINPSRMWTVVALITGLDLFGHALERTIGQSKGWLFTSLAGGFISSTATTLSIATQSKKNSATNSLVSSAIFSNMASFFQIAIVIGAINSRLLIESTTILLSLIISSLILGVYFFFKKEKENTNELTATKQSIKEKQIINISVALKFALLFLIIRLISKISLEYFGSSGFLVTTGLGALSGLDAVLINAAELAGKNITFEIALWAIILANATNLILKSVYSYLQGSREFALKLSISLIIIIFSSIAGIFLH